MSFSRLPQAGVVLLGLSLPAQHHGLLSGPKPTISGWVSSGRTPLGRQPGARFTSAGPLSAAVGVGIGSACVGSSDAGRGGAVFGAAAAAGVGGGRRVARRRRGGGRALYAATDENRIVELCNMAEDGKPLPLCRYVLCQLDPNLDPNTITLQYAREWYEQQQAKALDSEEPTDGPAEADDAASSSTTASIEKVASLEDRLAGAEKAGEKGEIKYGDMTAADAQRMVLEQQNSPDTDAPGGVKLELNVEKLQDYFEVSMSTGSGSSKKTQEELEEEAEAARRAALSPVERFRLTVQESDKQYEMERERMKQEDKEWMAEQKREMREFSEKLMEPLDKLQKERDEWYQKTFANEKPRMTAAELQAEQLDSLLSGAGGGGGISSKASKGGDTTPASSSTETSSINIGGATSAGAEDLFGATMKLSVEGASSGPVVVVVGGKESPLGEVVVDRIRDVLQRQDEAQEQEGGGGRGGEVVALSVEEATADTGLQGLSKAETMLILPPGEGKSAGGGMLGALFGGGGGGGGGGGKQLKDADVSALIKAAAKDGGVERVLCLAAPPRGEKTAGIEDEVVFQSKKMGFDYTVVRANQPFAAAGTSGPVPEVTPAAVDKKGASTKLSLPVAAEAIVQSLMHDSARNATLSVAGIRNVEDDMATDFWNDEFLKLNGPELRRVSFKDMFGASASAGEEGGGLVLDLPLQVFSAIRSWAQEFEEPGTGLTTPVEVSYSEAAGGIVKMSFTSKYRKYDSKRDVKRKEKDDKMEGRETRDKDGAGYAAASSSSSTSASLDEAKVQRSKGKEGGLRFIVELTPYPRVRVMRCDMDAKTVVKVMSEQLILDSFDRTFGKGAKLDDLSKLIDAQTMQLLVE